MQKKIIALSLAATLLVGCSSQLASKTPPAVKQSPELSVLVPQQPIQIPAQNPQAPGVTLNKITVDKQTHAATFTFGQQSAGMPFNITVKPQDGDVCVHNMTMMYRMLAHEMDCSGTAYCAPGNIISCGALAHTLKNNGEVTSFLRTTGAICR
ncbi:MAG: hypothetical protein K0S08_1321 [Gammaproteobacteria bacterium]|jgi:hypothetical protein|nr:hypothetical protein [Gammaproteobacteria bacterium]